MAFGINVQICKIMNEHVDDVVFLKICFESNKDMVSLMHYSRGIFFYHMQTGVKCHFYHEA